MFVCYWIVEIHQVYITRYSIYETRFIQSIGARTNRATFNFWILNTLASYTIVAPTPYFLTNIVAEIITTWNWSGYDFGPVSLDTMISNKCCDYYEAK